MGKKCVENKNSAIKMKKEGKKEKKIKQNDIDRMNKICANIIKSQMCDYDKSINQ